MYSPTNMLLGMQLTLPSLFEGLCSQLCYSVTNCRLVDEAFVF